MNGSSGREGTIGTFDLESVRAMLGSAPEVGRLRPLGLGQVITGQGTLDALPAVVSALRGTAGGPLAVLADSTPIAYRGGDLTARVTELLAPFGPVNVTLLGPPDGGAHADEATVAASVHGVEGASAVITVGSGTLADLGKIAAERGGGLPHVIVQTAASVNGFADDQSVLLVDGVKRTVPSRWPDVLLIDSEILAEAPSAMNLAGVGDLVSMYTAPADWYLASAIGIDDSYAPTLVSMVRPHGERLLDLAGKVGASQQAAVAELTHLLTLSGITMGSSGRTAVSSGMEHTVSHLLEMAAGTGPARLHGAQVGVATIVAATTWHHVRDAIETGRCVPRIPDPDERRARIEDAFGPLSEDGSVAAECWNSYRRKLEWLTAHPNAIGELLDRWAEHTAVLDTLLVEPERLAVALATAGVPSRFGELDPPVDPKTARWAVASCHLMRDRFSVADLADLLGVWEDDDVDAVLERSDQAGART